MSSKSVRDQAYQFFQQEALELLQTLETGLLTLRDEFTVPKVHNLMRAAHSIKGGAASVGLSGIQQIAHKLEDVLRALYRREGAIDPDLDEALLLAYDCLRVPLQDQISHGSYDEAAAWSNAEPIFTLLETFLSEDMGANIELPTAAELGVDIAYEVFTGDVDQGLERLENVLENPHLHEVRGEIYTTAEVFIGLGELLSLPGFAEINHRILQALQMHPGDSLTIGHIAIANLRAAQQIVLAGDRDMGGSPSADLLAFATNSLDSGSELTSAPSLAAAENNDLLSDLFALELTDLLVGQSTIDQASPTLRDLTENLCTANLFGPNLSDSPISELPNELEIGVFDPVIPNPASQQSDHLPLVYSLTENVSNKDDDQLALTDTDLAALAPDDSLDDVWTTPEIGYVPDVIDGLAEPHDLVDDVTSLFAEPQEASSELLEDIFGQPENLLDLTSETDDFLLDQAPNSLLTDPDQIPENLVEKLPAPNVISSSVTGSLNPTISKVAVAISQPIASVPSAKSSQSASPPVNESVRVDSTRLERINNLVGELVTQENGSLLQNQQLQGQLKTLQQQFNRFEQLTKKLETWMDQSQRTEVRGCQFSDLTPQMALSRGAARETAQLSENSDKASISLNFDPLQMDSYSDLYTVVQASVEEILQMSEIVRDMTLVTQRSQQTQRKKQQTLKQVRNDLLWARMMPIGDILTRFPRMVRDLSNQYQKQVNFIQTGGFTLIDKGILEKLYDPLVHLIRNAFDHGTETPEDRLAKGKPAEATIEIRAYHRGNQTFIEVRDDGRGIDLEKVRAATIAQGLFSAAEATVATAEQLYQSLFSPSFSTASTVSELSGRGMGLSAVQNQVKALRGNIALSSKIDQGTAFTIRLPLTLSIAKLLVFSVDSIYMAISVDSLLAIVTAPDADIQTIQGQPFYQYEDQLIPLYPTSSFAHHYPLPKGLTGRLQSIPLPQQDKTPLLLIADGDSVIALEVDQILNEQELVIKPFGTVASPPPYLYGCTILGDGSLIPVIDGAILVDQWKNPVSREFVPANVSQMPPIVRSATALNSPIILVIDDSLTTRQNLTLTLHKAGYDVIQAGNGREALEKLRQEPRIQAIFCDVEMPVMNGFEFLNACRKQDPPLQLPIIMLSSRSSEKHRGMAKLLGASHYLTKPYLEQGLLAELRACLND